MTPELYDLLNYLEGEEEYEDLRVLEDGTIVGTQRLIFTRALFIGLTRDGFERRYCYEDMDAATEACRALKTGDDMPMEGYVAHRVVRG